MLSAVASSTIEESTAHQQQSGKGGSFCGLRVDDVSLPSTLSYIPTISPFSPQQTRSSKNVRGARVSSNFVFVFVYIPVSSLIIAAHLYMLFKKLHT